MYRCSRSTLALKLSYMYNMLYTKKLNADDDDDDNNYDDNDDDDTSKKVGSLLPILECFVI